MENLFLKTLQLEDKAIYIKMFEDIHKTYPISKSKKEDYEEVRDMTDEEWDAIITNARKREKGEDKYGIRFFEYFLVENNNFIGAVQIKPEMEKISAEFKKYGGHISYQVVPFKRGQHYGTYLLHLALEKCQEFGLEEVMVTCREDNIGSAKVIENNYGVLKEILLYEGTENTRDFGTNRKIYNINVAESLEKFRQSESKMIR